MAMEKTMSGHIPFNAESALDTSGGRISYFRLNSLADERIASIDRLPVSIKILLVCALRSCDGFLVTAESQKGLASQVEEVGVSWIL